MTGMGDYENRFSDLSAFSSSSRTLRLRGGNGDSRALSHTSCRCLGDDIDTHVFLKLFHVCELFCTFNRLMSFFLEKCYAVLTFILGKLVTRGKWLILAGMVFSYQERFVCVKALSNRTTLRLSCRISFIGHRLNLNNCAESNRLAGLLRLLPRSEKSKTRKFAQQLSCTLFRRLALPKVRLRAPKSFERITHNFHDY